MKLKFVTNLCISLLFVSITESPLIAGEPVNLSTGTIVMGGSPGTVSTASGLQFTVTSPYDDSCNINSEFVSNLFDGNPYSKYCYLSWDGSSIPNEVVLHYLNGSVSIASLGLTSANDADRRDPKSWQLFGSIDGINWTSIADFTYSGDNFDYLGRYSDYLNVNFSPSNYYSYIKFVVTDIRDLNSSTIADSGGPVVQYSELRIFGTSTNVPLPPTISTLSVNIGSTLGGTSTTISGTNLSGVKKVKIGGVDASLGINTSTSISILTPSNSAGIKDVSVTTDGGTVTKVAAFTYCDYNGFSATAMNSVGSKKSSSPALTRSQGVGACQNASSR